MALIDLPEDILLNVVSKFGDLDDILSLLSTCKSLHSLSAYKHLWLTYLTYVSKYHALCCPIYVHLYSYSTVELRQFALNTHRLKSNLGSASPRITGPVLRYKYAEEEELDGAGANILTVIPYTCVAVIFCEGKILCRDLRRQSQSLSTGSTFIKGLGDFVMGYTYEYRLTELYVALIIRQSQKNIITVVCINTQDSQSPPELLWRVYGTVQTKSIFILDNIVGYISFFYLSQMRLLLVDIHDYHRYKELILELPDSVCSFKDYTPRCLVHNGELYLYLCSNSQNIIYRIEFDRSFPSVADNGYVKEKAELILVMNENTSLDSLDNITSRKMWCKMYRMTTRGLQTAQTISTLDQRDQKPRRSRLSFSPLKYQDKMIYSEYDLKRTQIEIPGEVAHFDHSKSRYLTCISHTGTYMMMIIDTSSSSTKNLELRIFHFDSEKGKITHRNLEVPECISLEKVYSISIEERSGIVYLADVHGWLFGLQYGGKDNCGERNIGEMMEVLSINSPGHVLMT